jgi:hypothetical protein
LLSVRKLLSNLQNSNASLIPIGIEGGNALRYYILVSLSIFRKRINLNKKTPTGRGTMTGEGTMARLW